MTLLPITVSAGVIGNFFSNIFKNAKAENIVSCDNIQNMALLAAVTSPLPKDQIIFEPIVEGGALVANIGPLGTVRGSIEHKPTSDQISVYVVHEGDTLSQIAEMFNVTVNTIKWGNDLSSNTLQVGQTLVILPIPGVKHTVVRGDTPASIAKKYKGDIDEIMAYNDLKKDQSLIIGSTVIIPDGEISTLSPSYVAASSASNLKEYKGYYIRPVASGVKTQGLHGHNAIDIGAPVGTPIVAAASGEVIISRTGGWNGGYGNYVVIKHSNGTQTLYAHNSVNYVSAGDWVEQGETIAAIGVSGKVTGPHIHFEIRGAKNPF
ncbi:MAG: peptidoglycan DD-metalloendopeptidase family protein [Candidatus Zambryskibacteria bacterium]|nr:peptidoglycan DD-metalloendopeptidase family protein [Candidatus Zambryskibacteria bacterium]